MTGTEAILMLMAQGNQNLHDKYWYIKEALEEEYGLGWTLKEIAEAKGHINELINKWKKRRSQPAIQQAVERLFYGLDKDKEKGKAKFIGAKMVTPEEYALYAKALYFVAGVQLQKEL